MLLIRFGELWVMPLMRIILMVMVLIMMIVMMMLTVMVRIWSISDNYKSHNLLFISKDHPSGFKTNRFISEPKVN